MKPKLAVIATHPIQYHAPWFVALAQRPEIDLTVYFVRELSQQKQGAGFDVPFAWDIPLRSGYRSVVLESPPTPRSFHRWFAQDGIDVVLTTGWSERSLVLAAIAARWARIPVIVRGETSGLKPRGFLVSVCHRMLLRLYDAFLVIGLANRHFYQQHAIEPEKMFAAPYFVENQRFAEQVALVKRDRLRSQWGIPEPAVCYLFAGKLQPKKRVMDFLAALKQAAADGCPMHGLVVGAGELLPAAQAFVEQHRLPVSFAGFLNQSEIASAYVAADALVLPSDYGETWGLVVNEAMACGRPAFVSDRVGCHLDLVIPGKTGEVFPFGDVGALSGLLQSYSRRSGDLAAMGESARARVMENYGVEQSVEAVLRAVDYVLRPP